MKVLHSNTLFTVESQYNEEIGTGVAGQKIIIDPGYAPNQHARTWGMVEYSGNKTMFKKGDKIYFHYGLTANNDSKVEIEGKQMFLSTHDRQIFCAVRDGQIIMNGDFVLVSPVKEESQDVEVDGKVIKGKKKGVIFIPGEKEKFRIGILKAIGDTDLEVKTGDQVSFLPESEFENEIEGERYFVMRQEDLIGKWHTEDSE